MSESMLMLEKKLDRAVDTYCGRLCAQCQKQRGRSKKLFSGFDYPAMACSSADNLTNVIKKAYSHRMEEASCHPILKREIAKYGEIGKIAGKGIPRQNNVPDYPLGNCAEQHAANKVLKRSTTVKLGNIHYSVAMRPRTRVPFNSCLNCKTILPNVR